MNETPNETTGTTQPAKASPNGPSTAKGDSNAHVDSGESEGSPAIKAAWRFVAIFGLVAIAVWLSMLAFQGFRSENDQSDLDVIAYQDMAPESETNHLIVAGRVLYAGDPAVDATVWFVARDVSGNRVSSTNSTIDSDGQFRLERRLPAAVTNYSDIRVQAREHGRNLWRILKLTPPNLRGQTVLNQSGFRRQANIMSSKLWPCTLAFFLVSILIGFAIHVVKSEWRRQLYIASVMSALAVTTAMLCAITEAYMKVKASVSPDQTWSVGFISIFQASYAKGVENQWMISVTGPPKEPANADAKKPPGKSQVQNASPDATADSPTVIQGFGAPLWVVFLAVIGAALSTVALIVKEIRMPPAFFADDPTELRKRLLELVQNQFFMLFAPLGGMFTYQALVLTGAVAQPFVVAIAALGAGATLNVLLSVAVYKASEALRKAWPEPKPETDAQDGAGEKKPGVQPHTSAPSPSSQRITPPRTEAPVNQPKGI
jgi:hypothetical protein